MLKNDKNVVIEDTKVVKKGTKATKGKKVTSEKETATDKKVTDKVADKKVSEKATKGTKTSAKKSTESKTSTKGKATKKSTESKTTTKGKAVKTSEATNEKAVKEPAKKATKSKTTDKATKKSKGAGKKVEGTVKAEEQSTADKGSCTCKGNCKEDKGSCKCEKGTKTSAKVDSKYGNVSLTCRADILADICGTTVVGLIPLFNMRGVKLKYITDFKPELYATDDEIEIKDTDEVELDTTFEAWLALNSFETALTLSNRLGNTLPKDVAEAAKIAGVELNTCRPIDKQDAEFFISLLSNKVSIYEIAEKLKTSVEEVKSFVSKIPKATRPTLHKVIDVMELDKFKGVISTLTTPTLEDIVSMTGCSLCQANEFARQHNIKIQYNDVEVAKRATFKDLEKYLTKVASRTLTFEG